MFKSLDEMVHRIAEKSKLPKEEILERIKAKQSELGQLITPEGAAYIVAKELSLDFFAIVETKELKIKSIIPGMKNVDVVGRAVKVFPVREFQKEERKGKYASLIIADETGSIRVVVWSKDVEQIEKGEIIPGMIVRVRSGYTKSSLQGEPEIHLGARSKLMADTSDVKTLPELEAFAPELERVYIAELKDGDEKKEIRGTILQVFESRPFFEVCPKCGKRAEEKSGVWACRACGQIERPDYRMVTSLIIDDGTDNIRATFFGRLAEQLLGISTGEALKISKESGNEKKPIIDRKENLLGKEIIVSGETRFDTFSNRLNFRVRELISLHPDPKAEAKKFLKQLEKKLAIE